MLNLEPIKARLAEATPGPWELGEVCEDASRRFVSGAGLIIATPRDWAGHMDAGLIASAPQDLAALVAEVERLRKEDEENINKISELQERNDQLVEENITLRNTNAARPAATVRKRILE